MDALDYMITKKVIKPPLGIMPRMMWIDARRIELESALDRYMKSYTEIPIEWIEEYNELIKLLR